MKKLLQLTMDYLLPIVLACLSVSRPVPLLKYWLGMTCGKELTKKMALILVTASCLLVFGVPVQHPTSGTFQPQDDVGSA